MTPSDKVTIDLTNYKDKVGQRVMPGRYRVVVDDAELDTASTGNQMINLWLRVLDGEFEGATIIDRLVLTEKSLFRVVGFMQGLGLQTPKKRLQIDVRSWIGRVVYADVDDGDPYRGRVKSEVRGYERIQPSMAGPEDLEAEMPDLGDVASTPLAEEAGEVDLEGVEL